MGGGGGIQAEVVGGGGGWDSREQINLVGAA